MVALRSKYPFEATYHTLFFHAPSNTRRGPAGQHTASKTNKYNNEIREKRYYLLYSERFFLIWERGATQCITRIHLRTYSTWFIVVVGCGSVRTHSRPSVWKSENNEYNFLLLLFPSYVMCKTLEMKWAQNRFLGKI